LTTERLVLRPFGRRDAPLVQRYAGERAIAATTLNIPHPYLDGMAESWIATHSAAWSERRLATFAIATGTEPLVGAVALEIVEAHRRAELGYWIAIPFWGRGYATEAARAAVRFAFGELDLERVCAFYLAGNPASGRVLAKVGFRPEGRLRRHVVKWNRVEDLEVVGLLRSEWAAESR
jgi:RimJ/RimL family protein N-acetyltransferase